MLKLHAQLPSQVPSYLRGSRELAADVASLGSEGDVAVTIGGGSGAAGKAAAGTRGGGRNSGTSGVSESEVSVKRGSRVVGMGEPHALAANIAHTHVLSQSGAISDEGNEFYMVCDWEPGLVNPSEDKYRKIMHEQLRGYVCVYMCV